MTEILLLSLLGSWAFQPSAQDLLETGLMTWISEIPRMAPMLDLRDGEPMLLGRSSPAPPWGSFRGAELRTPVEAGVWGGGSWTAEYESPAIPESSFASTAGLLENTRSRNRYSGALVRPLPASFGLIAVLAREDTLARQQVQLRRGPLDITGSFWQESADGLSSWLRFRSGAFKARGGLASSRAGEDLWQGLVSAAVSPGAFAFEAAAGASVEDSLEWAEAHSRFSWRGPFEAVCRLDASLDGSDDPEGGWSAGVNLGTQPGAGFSAGAAAPPGERPEAFLAAWYSSTGIEVIRRHSGFVFGGHAGLPADITISGALLEDTLRTAVSAMPGIRYGAAGLICAGGRFAWSGVDEGEDLTELDLMLTFSIERFSLVASAEDVTDDFERQYSYGLVWSFQDSPAVPQAGRGR